MNDITNLRLSKRAEEVAEQLKNTGKFDSAVAAAKFALAYAVKNYYDEFDPASYVVSDSLGTNYNVGSFDNDSTLIQSIRALYPGVETPFIYVRALAVFGLVLNFSQIELFSEFITIYFALLLRESQPKGPL